MADKVFPTDITAKANPVDADILLIADSADNNEMKQITIGSITADIWDGLIVDSSASTTTTYSSDKINTLNGTQDTTATNNFNTLNTNKLNRAAQLRTGNGTWKTTYNNGSGDEVELALWTANYVLQSNGAAAAPTWVAPAVDINAQTEDTAWDMDADFALVYDNSASAVRKQKVAVFKATSAEVTTGTATNKFITPAQLTERARKIYVDVVPATTSISWTLTTCYTQTIDANTFTANSAMKVFIALIYWNASSGDATFNIKFWGTTVYTTWAFSVTWGANTPMFIEADIYFDATDGTANLHVKRFGTSSVAITQTASVATASLTSDQTFTIDAIRTGSGGSVAYLSSSLMKL